MGAVSLDIKKKEREFEPLTLSDRNVVEYLILFRSKIDTNYSADINYNIYEAGDAFEFNRELIAIYASLDQIIDECGFKEKELKLLRYLFEGYTLGDIIEHLKLYKRRTAYRTYNRIIEKIIKINNENWKKTVKKWMG